MSSSRKAPVIIIAEPRSSTSSNYNATTYLSPPRSPTYLSRSHYPRSKPHTQYSSRSIPDDPRSYSSYRIKEPSAYYNECNDYDTGSYAMSSESSRSNSPSYSYNSESQSAYGQGGYTGGYTGSQTHEYLVRTSQPTGGRSGGPPHNPDGYLVTERSTPGKIPVAVHNRGAGYRDPNRRPNDTQYSPQF